MKAVVHDVYGAPTEVLRLDDIDVPQPGPDEVLIKLHAASINPADWHMVRGEPLVARASIGLRKPKKIVPGADFAGTVEAVGTEATEQSGVAVGDGVYGEMLQQRLGTFAQYVVVPAAMAGPVPQNLTMEQAAAVPLAGITALQAMRDRGEVEAGSRVLIVGASGGVGHLAVQIGVAMGAEVTGVCSTGNLEFVESLGAVRVIDYTCESYVDNGEYDLVLQLSGPIPASAFRPVMTRNGTLLILTGDSASRFWGPIGRVVKAMVQSPFVSQTFSMLNAKPNAADLATLTEMIEAGQLRPEIARTCDLAGVPVEIARVEQAHTRGKVVVSL